MSTNIYADIHTHPEGGTHILKGAKWLRTSGFEQGHSCLWLGQHWLSRVRGRQWDAAIKKTKVTNKHTKLTAAISFNSWNLCFHPLPLLCTLCQKCLLSKTFWVENLRYFCPCNSHTNLRVQLLFFSKFRLYERMFYLQRVSKSYTSVIYVACVTVWNASTTMGLNWSLAIRISNELN